MKQTHQLEFITPCFCSGADQGKAEIRASSIRGELRWWFRALGGTPAEEALVFGGIGKSTAKASALSVRVVPVSLFSNEADLPKWNNRNAPGDPMAYLAYFATVSGETKGQRWKKDAFFSPGSRFNLQLNIRPKIAQAVEAQTEMAIKAFVNLGSLGMRATRCFGALRDMNQMTEQEFHRWVQDLPNICCSTEGHIVPHSSYAWQECTKQLGSFLKEFRKSNKLSAKSQTVLGSSNPRLKSAMHLRPVWVKEGLLPVVFYTDAALPRSVVRGRNEVARYFYL